MILESHQPAELKGRYKIVRRDDYKDVPGEIVAANTETGECTMNVTAGGATETKTLSFGPNGIAIVTKR